MTATATSPDAAVQRQRSRPVAWWGMVALIATEATVFAGLLSSYFFMRAVSNDWPQGGIREPELQAIVPLTIVLLASSAPVALAEAAVERNRMATVRSMLAVSFLMGGAFLANQAIEYHHLDFGARDNAYASHFYVITGLHGLHVAVGLAISVVVQIKAWTGRIDAGRHLTLSLFGLYWHFVDVVWIFVFASLYLAVRW